uniref:Rib43a-like protein with coiled-coils protein 2 n=1 Tax=Triatoma infestans TaxID=30076 RepID=A0A170YPS4_TRIIF
MAREVDVYRLTEQQKYKSREFDLNDPKRIVNQLPMRFEDIIDPRELTMGSFLKFPSEDYDGEKAKLLKKHLWQCLAKQMTENLINKKNYKISQLQSGKDVMREDALVNKAMEREEMMRMQAAKSTMEYNLRKADFETQKKRLEKQQATKDEQTHIDTCINSDMFTKNSGSIKSSLGYIANNFGDLKRKENLEIQETQKNQIKETELRKNIDKATDKYWKEVIDHQTSVNTAAELLDTQRKKEINREVFEENKKLAAVQAIQRESSRKMAKDNFPTDEFFDYFNTTSH